MADYISKFQYNGTTWDMKDAEARQALASCVNNGYYDSNAKKIILRHGNTTIVQIDATDFIKDGMVSNVQVVNGYLVITFNTDAGQEPIRIPITDIFNPDNYYTKSATNGLLALKQDIIQDLAQIRQGANAGATAYQKPQGGIPLSDINQNGIDNVPTNGSNNLVRSGGVQNELALGAVYDVSAHNNSATFASLQALLSNANIDTLIPTSVRKGGMSIKFVRSSDNKYVQYRLTTTSWSTSTAAWESEVSNYYVCETAEGTQIKVVDAPGYILGENCCFKVKFTHKNTVYPLSNTFAKLNVNNTGAKNLYFNGYKARLGNSWEEGAIVDVYYDKDADNGEGAYFSFDYETLNTVYIDKVFNKNINTQLVSVGEIAYDAYNKKLGMYYHPTNNINIKELEEIPLDKNKTYIYKNQKYHYNGTELVPDIDVTLTDCIIDLTDYIGDGDYHMASSGTDFTNTKNMPSSVFVRVDHNTVLTFNHALCLVVFGYAGRSMENPILLSAESNPSTITYYDLNIRVPEGVNYILFAYKSVTSATVHKKYDLSFNIYDIDVMYPLNGTYHTISSAIQSVQTSYRKLNQKIVFSVSPYEREMWTFKGTTLDVWNDSSYWYNESISNKHNKGIVNEGAGGWKLNINCQSKDNSKDFIVEAITTYKSYTENSQYIFGLKDIEVRFNYGNIQIPYKGESGQYLLSVGVFDPLVYGNASNYFHTCVVKSRKEVEEGGSTITKHYIDFYINGRKVGDTKDVTAIYNSPNASYAPGTYISTFRGVLLYRATYHNIGTDSVSDLVSEHYNNGNPFNWDSDRKELILELLPENMGSNYMVDNVTGYNSKAAAGTTYTVLKESPYDEVLYGNGAPDIIPKYLSQRYIDKTTGEEYLSYGNSTTSDWKKNATSEDVLALKQSTKTVNGQSIWGSGDIEGGGSGGSSNVVSVIDNGAVGDGETDDTVAIMTALEKARVQGKALFFPNGTYLTKKGLVLTSNMHVIGEPGAVLKNGTKKAVGGKDYYTRITANASEGATQITVADASGFDVGQEIVIIASIYYSYQDTQADITAINGNVLTIDTSRFTDDGTNKGLKHSDSSFNNGYVLSDFALIRTVRTRDANNVIVEGLTLRTVSDMDEPHVYPSSPLSQDAGPNQTNFRVYNVTVEASANDGISLQGAGKSEVIGCRVDGQKWKGIHWGTTHDIIIIKNNIVTNCGSANHMDDGYFGSGGLFFCVNNSRCIIQGNQIENCYQGIYGFNDTNGQDRDSVISDNTITNSGLHGIYLHGGNRVIVNANIFKGFTGASTPIHVEHGATFKQMCTVISNNIISDFASSYEGPAAIKINNAMHVAITGNLISKLVTQNPVDGGQVVTRGTNTDIVVANSEKVIITGNMVDGIIDTTDTNNVNVVAANNISN